MKTCILSFAVLFVFSCSDSQDAATGALSDRKKALKEEYEQVPEPSYYLKTETVKPVYTILESRYASHLAALKKESDMLGAKLLMVVLTPELGESVTVNTQQGTPFLIRQAQAAGIEVLDLTTVLSGYSPQQITQMPKDGHWSAAGSQIIATHLSEFLKPFTTHKSSAKFDDQQRPKILGDLEASTNQVLDGGKDLPYNLVTNSQGFRMNYDLQFPKTKQRILFFGDSQIYSPFLDNDKTATGILQVKLADKEIINAGVIGYSVDDYVSLLKEKAKFAEPDIIVLVTNPNDITDQFFSQRNRLGRNPDGYEPTKEELELYKLLPKTK